MAGFFLIIFVSRSARNYTHPKRTRKELGKLLQRAVILYFFRQPKGPIDQRFATGVSVFSPPPPPSLINRPTPFFSFFFCCCCCSRSFIYCALVLLNKGPVVCLLKRTSTCSLDPDDDLQYGEREREREREKEMNLREPNRSMPEIAILF